MHHYLIRKELCHATFRENGEEARLKKPLSAWPLMFGEHEAKRIVFSQQLLVDK
jgi:hypothetical protein